MKTNNQIERSFMELTLLTAANEDGISPPKPREPSGSRKPAWSPREVWRTRVKVPAPDKRPERAPA